jgi:hypothetical protein
MFAFIIHSFPIRFTGRAAAATILAAALIDAIKKEYDTKRTTLSCFDAF